jgi:hypothetical protein
VTDFPELPDMRIAHIEYPDRPPLPKKGDHSELRYRIQEDYAIELTALRSAASQLFEVLQFDELDIQRLCNRLELYKPINNWTVSDYTYLFAKMENTRELLLAWKETWAVCDQLGFDEEVYDLLVQTWELDTLINKRNFLELDPVLELEAYREFLSKLIDLRNMLGTI